MNTYGYEFELEGVVVALCQRHGDNDIQGSGILDETANIFSIYIDKELKWYVRGDMHYENSGDVVKNVENEVKNNKLIKYSFRRVELVSVVCKYVDNAQIMTDFSGVRAFLEYCNTMKPMQPDGMYQIFSDNNSLVHTAVINGHVITIYYIGEYTKDIKGNYIMWSYCLVVDGKDAMKIPTRPQLTYGFKNRNYINALLSTCVPNAYFPKVEKIYSGTDGLCNEKSETLYKSILESDIKNQYVKKQMSSVFLLIELLRLFVACSLRDDVRHYDGSVKNAYYLMPRTPVGLMLQDINNLNENLNTIILKYIGQSLNKALSTTIPFGMSADLMPTRDLIRLFTARDVETISETYSKWMSRELLIRSVTTQNYIDVNIRRDKLIAPLTSLPQHYKEQIDVMINNIKLKDFFSPPPYSYPVDNPIGSYSLDQQPFILEWRYLRQVLTDQFQLMPSKMVWENEYYLYYLAMYVNEVFGGKM